MQPNLFSDIKSINTFRISVLLIDDQPMIAEAVRRALEDEKDIEFHYCQDPSKAIKIANRIHPTIILQDLVMPEVNGLMMVRFFRVNKETNQIPIIILSTKEDPKVKSEAFSLGVNDYLVKLPDKIELIARLRYHSTAYLYHRQRDEAFAALEESQRKLHEANQALEKLSSLDGLTGIANRRQFDKVIANEWNRAIRNYSPISLLMLDIDFFKLYNDTYGHQKGDTCLKQVAEVLKANEKRPADLAARYGGEEFAFILPETDKHGALEKASSILNMLREANIPHKASTVHTILTASIGVATMNAERGTSPDNLILQADKALYIAKERGRNQLVVSGEE
ncbi:MAG: diguanylate cyclase [Proteobacteria bacterium]|nr:diguanylate cyclase [Desulfobulbaceae bacterium]MBU4153207.1 diguanylate cyclase [Pseudomonadota bacterium]